MLISLFQLYLVCVNEVTLGGWELVIQGINYAIRGLKLSALPHRIQSMAKDLTNHADVMGPPLKSKQTSLQGFQVGEHKVLRG